MKVISDIWHPNIEKNGDVCISILHEPGIVYYSNIVLYEPFIQIYQVMNNTVSLKSLQF